MKKELHESNWYEDKLFPFKMYTVTRQECIPHGRGFHDLHWHEELQFTMAVKGQVTMQVNGNDFILESGQGIFINKGLLHITTDITEDGKYVSFNFPEKLLCFFPGSRMEYDYVQPYTDEFSFTVMVLYKEIDWQAAILEVLQKLKEIQDGAEYFGREYEISNMVTHMWLMLINHVTLQNENSHNKALKQQQERIHLMLSCIHQNYAEDLSLTDIAKSANISVAECSRCFRKMIHTTPYSYLIEYRLKQSMELLYTTSLSVTEVGARVGFNHVNHFVQSFKKNQGITPNEYRKEREQRKTREDVGTQEETGTKKIREYGKKQE